MLQDRTMTLVIDQNPKQQAQNAVDLVLQHYGYLDEEVIHPAAKGMPFTLHGPFNAA